jgi:hypothetical protein
MLIKLESGILKYLIAENKRENNKNDGERDSDKIAILFKRTERDERSLMYAMKRARWSRNSLWVVFLAKPFPLLYIYMHIHTHLHICVHI